MDKACEKYRARSKKAVKKKEKSPSYVKGEKKTLWWRRESEYTLNTMNQKRTARRTCRKWKRKYAYGHRQRGDERCRNIAQAKRLPLETVESRKVRNMGGRMVYHLIVR